MPINISIRLKIIFISGIVIAGIAGANAWYQYRLLHEQFAESQAENAKRIETMAHALFASQGDRLQVLARMLAETPALRDAVQRRDGAGLRESISPLWSELNLGQGLAGVAVLNVQQQILGVWGSPDIDRMQRLARNAVDHEMPQTDVACNLPGPSTGNPGNELASTAGGSEPFAEPGAQLTCMHQIVLPMVFEGKVVGVIGLASGLENVVLDLRRLGKSEIALLASDLQAGSQPLAGLHLVSVSGGAQVRLMVQKALRTPPLNSGALWHDAETGWEIGVFPAAQPGDGRLHFLVASDVRALYARIENAAWRNLAWGGGVLLVAMLLLHLLLRPAMHRIRHVSELLPLLGMGRFDEVRQAVVRKPARYAPRDEMHALETLAGELAGQLQRLHEADSKHARTLAAQAAQLARERDFVTGLLDTAPVLIVTYGEDGLIRMINAHALNDTDLPQQAVLGHPFQDLFMYGSQRRDHSRQLGRLKPGEVAHGDGVFLRANGIARDLVWFHSRMRDEDGAALFLSVGLDVTAHRQAEQQLQSLLEHDGTTGLLNRRSFQRELDTTLLQGRRGLMLVCDIDDFRSINDLHGHEVGDRVLTGFVQHVLRMEPAPAFGARLGGDSFAWLYFDIGAADGIRIARYFSHVSLPASDWPEQNARHLSASVGIVIFPEHGERADTLLGNAELALTQARSKGHGAWHLYSAQETSRESADRRAHWRTEVEKALEEGRFLLHFQPILHLQTGDTGHYEALIRMQGLDGRLIPPAMFIDTAEHTGLIRRIDRWVIRSVVALAAQHPDKTFALNLSSRSFDDDSALDAMREALATYGVQGRQLRIEITETAALANFEAAKHIMLGFREFGCEFGLDDFGVGYSSFQYLKELPVDFVKIDGSFIHDLAGNPDNMVFVRALNDAVKGFGKATIAEFVEDQETLEILREIGVDYVQGFLVGKPQPFLLT